MKCSLPPDQTTNRSWLHEQQNRLLGFEILTSHLKGHPVALSSPAIRERTAGTRLRQDKFYRKKFISLLLVKLGATNFNDALVSIRRMRDATR